MSSKAPSKAFRVFTGKVGVGHKKPSTARLILYSWFQAGAHLGDRRSGLRRVELYYS